MLKTIKSTPWPVILIILSFLCPSEFSLYIGGLRLPPHRCAIIVLLPLALFRIFSRPDIRICSFDILFILFNVWVVGVMSLHTEDQAGLIFGGSLGLESLGGYFVARAWIRDTQTFHAAFKFLLIALAAIICVSLPETLLAKHFTHDLMQSLTGFEAPRRIETRLGLTRAYGTFDHPIHLGTFCAALLALVWYATPTAMQRYQRTALVCIATFTALSSAPILCLVLQAGLIVWDRATRGLGARVLVTVTLVIAVFFAASLVSERSPFAWIATGMTIDSWTGYYRLLIWEHGLNNVWAHPLTGIGLADWERPWWMVSDSVDAFWLVLIMRTGIPTLLFLGAAIALLVYNVNHTASRHRHPFVPRTAKAWIISLIALSLAGCTVHYWNVLYSYFFFFLGMAGWIAQPAPMPYSQRKSAVSAPSGDRFAQIPHPLAHPQPAVPHYLPLVYTQPRS